MFSRLCDAYWSVLYIYVYVIYAEQKETSNYMSKKEGWKNAPWRSLQSR